MAGEFVGGITPYNMGMMPFYNNYANGVMLDDIYNSSVMTNPGIFSMDSSLFGGGMMGTPYMPYGGGSGYEQYYKNMEQYQDFMYDSQLRRSQKSRQVDFRANAPMESIQRQAEILHEKIMQNEQQQVIPALNKLLASVNGGFASGTSATQEELIAKADTIYKQMYNTSITEDLRKFGHGSFEQGLYQSLTLGFADRTTAEENISRINGAPVSRWESAKKITGNATGGALIGAGSMYALFSLPFLKKMVTSKPGFLAVIGAVVGAISGMTMSAFGSAPAVGASSDKKS